MTYKITRYPLSYYIDRIREENHFTLTRWGDGEWSAIADLGLKNCDGHRMYPAMCAELRSALKSPAPWITNMIYATSKGGKWGEHKARWCEENGVEIDWHHCDFLSDANWKGEFAPFIQMLRDLNVVLVGPPHLQNIPNSVFVPSSHVILSAQNCYLDIEDVALNKAERIDNLQADIVLVSAGMPAALLINSIALYASWRDCTIFDAGSTWDPYCGVKSRGIYRDIDWRPIIAKNTRT